MLYEVITDGDEKVDLLVAPKELQEPSVPFAFESESRFRQFGNRREDFIEVLVEYAQIRVVVVGSYNFV